MRADLVRKMKASHLLAVSGAALLLLPSQAAAQATKDETAGAKTDAPQNDGFGKDDIVVTAQRRSENIQAVPLSITAFSGKSLSELGIKSSADIGQIIPNVDIALPAGAGNQPIISIRGIGLNDFDTNNAGPNGVYIDEVYLSSPASQTFQMFDLERIEVLQGPQGTLYGRNSSGGAINFISVKPSDELKVNFHTEVGSYDTFNFEGGIGGPISSTLDGRVAVAVNKSRGVGYNTALGSREDGVSNGAGRISLLWKPASSLKILFNAHGGFVDNRPTEYRMLGGFVPGTQGDPEPTICSPSSVLAGNCVNLYGYKTPAGFYDGAYNRREKLKVNSLGSFLRLDYSAGAVTLSSISSYEHVDKIHPEDSDASADRLIEADFGVKANTLTQEFRLAGSKSNYDWTVGAYYLHEVLTQDQPIRLFLDFDKYGGFGIPAGVGAGDGIAQTGFDTSRQLTNAYAAYGQGTLSITDNFKLTLGGRYTRETKSFEYFGATQFQDGGINVYDPPTITANSLRKFESSNFSYRAVADYYFTPKIHLYASIASGFKSGDFNGSFLSTDPAQIERQLAPVRPETLTTYEVGFKSSFFDNRLTFNLTGFYNDYRDMQVFTLVSITEGNITLPVNVLDNAKKAHTYGLDLELIARPVDDLTIRLNAGLLETKLDEFVPNVDPTQPNFSGKQLPLAPHVSFSGLIDYKVPLTSGALDFQLSASYKGKQFFDISNDPYTIQAGYWIGNARVAYQFRKNWEVAIFGRNLANKKYFLDQFDLINPFGFVQSIPGAPRTIGAELNFKF